MVIQPAGENALMVYLGEAMDPAVSARVQALADALPEAHLRSLFEWQPFCGYISTLTEESPTYR